MGFLDDMMCCEYLIPMTLIIVIGLPLVPNKKLRYYTCYICYISVTSLICTMLLPMVLLRPRDIVNLKIAGKLIGYFTKILGIEWELRGGDVLKKDRGAIIVANHQSILDIMGMFNIWDVMDKCTAVAKKELLYFAPFGPMAWLGGLVFIDRVDPKSANNKLKAAAHLLHSKKAKLWLFPEGTRNKKGKVLLPFKKGAFRVAICTQAPIIPIVYSPYYFIDSVNKTFSEGKMVISVLEPIPTEGLTLDDIDSLKEKTYKLMSIEYEKLHKEIKSLQHADVNKNNT
ncbi:1-acyl-sn-glycerol-3-phosphate acyltransferase beta isoform X2 [Halyomorpha halys]|nr:1-acyl-sn-glycerol-3-phosphate acyltransferase beta-like isoform X2 [Halyomorpha halys]XP_014280832.1 1-acyl-sn-glycerol-3-phosphate acyltransferase beta-like isoform X2 [Halyomorpha halys]